MTRLVMVLIAIVRGILEYMEARRERNRKPLEGDRDPDLLSRAGRRVREWEDRARARGQSDQDRA